MPFAMASSASQGHFSAARTAAGTSASNEIKKRPTGRFFFCSIGLPRDDKTQAASQGRPLLFRNY
jgi:hypothetical protein